MEDARCVKCQLFITEDPLICDGICGSQYHRECIRRTTRQGNVNSFTCSPCNDIKPCHILKAFLVMNAKTEAILDKTSDLEKSIATLISNFNILFSDREVILSSIDKLNVSNGSLVEIFSKFADLAKKNNSLTKQLENTLSDINITPDLSSLKEEMADISFSIRGFEERIRAMISLPSCRNVASPPSIDASGATSFSGGSAPTPHRNSSKCHSFSSDSPALANSSRSRSELPSPLLAPSISAVGDQVSPPLAEYRLLLALLTALSIYPARRLLQLMVSTILPKLLPYPSATYHGSLRSLLSLPLSMLEDVRLPPPRTLLRTLSPHNFASQSVV